MKKLLLLLCLLGASFSLVSAQTGGRIFGAQQIVLDDNNPTHPRVYLSNLNGSLGIDNNGVTSPGFPNPCSLLDLSSTTKGFLPPRMTLAQELAICGGAPPEGMVVYNTTSHTFDMYNGSAWVPVGGGGGATTGWALIGNSGTNTLSNFLGTMDAQDLVIRTTNSERLRVLATGNVGIGDPSPVSLLTVGNGDKFQVNVNGNLIAVNGVPYSWPVSNSAGVLTNDASGNLSWAAVSGGGSGWSLTGDAGTSAGTNFIGTTDNQPFEIHVFQTDNKNKGSMRVMLYEPKDSSANITGGYQFNSIGFFNRGSVIAGGGEDGAINTIKADFSFIGGGINNQIRSQEGSFRNDVIGGGLGNLVTANYASIVGGAGNTVSGDYAVVGGGRGNFATASGSFVGGGGFDGESSNGNFATGSGSAIVGGLSNSANGFGSFVGGGNSNTSNNTFASIVGGVFNNASGYTSSIGGGYNNNAIGYYSTISGGNSNVSNGTSSIIAGGVSNIADGENAMILGGTQGSAPQYAQFAQSAGSFALQGDAQTSVFVLRNTTTDGVTATSLFLDGNSLKLTLPNNNTVYTFHIMVTGICMTTPGLYVGYDVKGLIYRDNAGNVNFIGAAPVATLLAGNIGGVSFTVAADNVGKALDLIVVGRATQTIRWVARVETVEAAF